MSALTDEGMAKVLGWKQVRAPYHNDRVWTKGEVFKDGYKSLPHFTTSQDAITAEIEARGLDYTVSNTSQANVPKPKRCFALVGDCAGQADTAPLALCAALRDYLKKN